jgi:hypothetical protein
LLSVPAEPVPEDFDDQPGTVPFLSVTAGSIVVDELDGGLDDGYGDSGEAWSSPRSAEIADEVDADAPSTAPPVEPASSSSSPLPRRTPLDETPVQWGPRSHPAPVPAPPPPHPLDAPAVARMKPPTGTGLPSGMATRGPAVVPQAPLPPPVPPVPVTEVPDRPTHPRVRRWFGRGVDPDAAIAPDDVAEPEASPAAPLAGPFAGAPEGLLDGVVPEADLGPGVRDPHGVESAMSRLSAGARRSALAPMAVASALLDPGEVADAAVQGELQRRPAVVVLTDRRLVVANDRRWAPDVRSFALDESLVVHGWQDDRRATLVFVRDGVGVTIESISDRPLARDLAQRIRARCAGGHQGVEPSS